MNVLEELRTLDVNDVGRWPLGFRAAVIVIVGDYEKVKDQLAGYGEVTVVDINGKPIAVVL